MTTVYHQLFHMGAGDQNLGWYNKDFTSQAISPAQKEVLYKDWHSLKDTSAVWPSGSLNSMKNGPSVHWWPLLTQVERQLLHQSRGVTFNHRHTRAWDTRIPASWSNTYPAFCSKFWVQSGQWDYSSFTVTLGEMARVSCPAFFSFQNTLSGILIFFLLI